ncbi:MAG: baseplate J/gp47 family protein [Fusobacteriaceae bacterium]|nr:baseplate J/gp47 family protein [Fusobacteriaceae bacterium]
MIKYYNKTPEEAEAESLDIFQKLTGETLMQADERTALIKIFVYGFQLLGNAINNAGSNNFSTYANREALLNMCKFKNIDIGKTLPSKTTIEFTRKSNLQGILAIPKGTITSAGEIEFQTIETKSFELNSEILLIEAEAVLPGSFSNNIQIGQINTLVDSIPTITAVRNTTITEGGLDEIDTEVLREIIETSPEGYSLAGPKGAYEFLAKNADGNVVDAFATSPRPKEVEITILLKNGVTPSTEIKNNIKNFINGDKKRPLNDLVSVLSPTEINYNVSLTWYLTKENEKNYDVISQKINEKVANFITATQETLGKDIDPDDLLFELKSIGVRRVVITEPAFTVLDRTKVGKGIIKSVQYGGTGDD